MWEKSWRDSIWSALDQTWDLIIIGGGITGAGILREARRAGLRVLLVEAHDFASGTSSRSSKLVHGGFRYLKNGQIKLVLESVRERERLLSEGRGLINPMGFLLVNYRDDPIPAEVFGMGLILYDLLALKWGHRRYDAYDMHDLCPSLSEEGLLGGYRYFDAQTDDARLVLRVIQEAVQDGGVALNYARVIHLLTNRKDQVQGILLRDEAPNTQGRTKEVFAPVIVNATGAWADDLRLQIGGEGCLRKLRGSHLLFPAKKFPLTRAVSFLHPVDGRPVFAFPWEGVTIVGTTDVDHGQELQTDPAISSAEAEYLLKAVQIIFPSLELKAEDVHATLAGVRPVINTGKSDPSKESREYILRNEKGLLTVTGGKLTTFRLMAHDALTKVQHLLPGHPKFNPHLRVLNEVPGEILPTEGLTPSLRLRLLGRYGQNASKVIECAHPGELSFIENSIVTWAELRWAARAEGVIHLDDLLLRRVRLGLLAPEGGIKYMENIRRVVQPELRWDDAYWEQEVEYYQQLWRQSYSQG